MTILKMLFQKKNKKLDSKVRFQHKQFTGKLITARNYKRTAAAIPETKFDKFLAKIGLGSKWAQIGVGLIVLALLYLVYLPNFLTVKNIAITGLSESQARDFEIAIRDEIANGNFFYPEKNLIFLRNAVVYDAMAKVPSVSKVSLIYKSLAKQELTIEAESKYEKYLVATPSKVYDVYNDGLLKGESGIKRDQWAAISNPNMVKIELAGDIQSDDAGKFLHASLVGYLENLNTKLGQIHNLKTAFYKFEDSPQPETVKIKTDELQTNIEEDQPSVEITQPESRQLSLPINSAEVHAFIYKGDSQNTYRVIFDATKDVQKSIDNLKLLLSQTSPERLMQLSYIDLRLEERAYLCLQGAPCNK